MQLNRHAPLATIVTTRLRTLNFRIAGVANLQDSCFYATH